MANKRQKGPPSLYPQPAYKTEQDPQLSRWMADRAKDPKQQVQLLDTPYYVVHPANGSICNNANLAAARKCAERYCDESGKETHIMERATGKVKESYEPD